jgi:hypothetical protein
VLQQSSPRSWEDLRQTLERYQAVGKVRHSRKGYLAGGEDKGSVGKGELCIVAAREMKDSLVEVHSTGREDTMAGHMYHEDTVREDGCTRTVGGDKGVERWTLSLAPIA